MSIIAVWKFERAYRILRRIADNHRAIGHDVEFIAVDSTYISLRCWTCHPVGTPQRTEHHDR
jgi:hypothetical protein